MVSETHRWRSHSKPSGARAVPGSQAGAWGQRWATSSVWPLPRLSSSPAAPRPSTMVTHTHLYSGGYSTQGALDVPTGQDNCRVSAGRQHQRHRCRDSHPQRRACPQWSLTRTRRAAAIAHKVQPRCLQVRRAPGSALGVGQRLTAARQSSSPAAPRLSTMVTHTHPYSGGYSTQGAIGVPTRPPGARTSAERQAHFSTLRPGCAHP